MEIVIPFAGFYNSIHDSEIDHTLEREFSDRATGCDVNHDLVGRVIDKCQWGLVHAEYAKEYAEKLAEALKVKFSFVTLESPKFYNYETDRIICEISADELERIKKETKPETLAEVAAENFTSRDGFISFYSPDVADWGDLCEWDHNQAGALLAAYVRQTLGDFDQLAEVGLMESASGNGRIVAWIGNATPDIDRLYKVWDYIQDRKER